MRIAEVIGRVTLSRFNPQLKGGRFLIALPMPLVGTRPRARPLAAKRSSSTTTWRGPRQLDRPERRPRGRQSRSARPRLRSTPTALSDRSI